MGLLWPSFRDGKWKLTGDPATCIYDDFYSYPGAELFYIFTINKKKGVLHYSHKVIVPAEYDSISISENGEAWDFNGYTLDANKKVVETKTFTRTFRSSPPPGILWGETKVDFLERKEMNEMDKRTYDLSEYKHVYYYNDSWIAIVKDNNSDKFGLQYGRKLGKIDFEYDDIFTVTYSSSPTSRDFSKAYAFKKGNVYGLFNKKKNYEPYPYEYDDIQQRYFMSKGISELPPDRRPYLVFMKNNKYGVDGFNDGVFHMIPFQYDDIVNRNVVVDGKYFGYWDDFPMRWTHIPPRYRSKPIMIKEFNIEAKRLHVFEAVNKDNKKVLIYRNGVELYRRK